MRTLFFPRYQRTFLRLGDVGSHPQFRHLGLPPKGYDFIERPMTWTEWIAALPKGLSDSWRAWGLVYREGRQAGLSLFGIVRFLWSRGLDRIVPGPNQAVASFLPTFPLTHQNEHWFLEIEDVTTLFRPYVLNGKTSEGHYRDLPVFPLVENMLASDKCLGILTHVRSTKDSIAKIFGSERISTKSECIQVPYLPRREVSEESLNELRSEDPIQFFFNNSWHQDLSNFYLRGGISILEAFDRALKDGLPVRLNLRSRIPKDIRVRFAELFDSSVVNLMDSFLPKIGFYRRSNPLTTSFCHRHVFTWSHSSRVNTMARYPLCPMVGVSGDLSEADVRKFGGGLLRADITKVEE
jgi:hypothetical protein